MIAKTSFENESEKQKYVLECDADFESRLDVMMKKICSIADLDFITLSGPTCSGKTTASKKLVSEFSERGKTVKIISLDDFFRNRSDLEREANGNTLDFDSEKALDIPVLREFMHDLQTKGEAVLPRFDFNLACRTGFEHFSMKDADIVVFEGIQAIYPVFTSLFEAEAKRKSLYISPLTGLEVNGVTVEPREIRLWRRIVRDYKFRSAEPEFSFKLWEGVVKNEDANILPFAGESDFMIDSLQGYEPCMLKKDLTELLLGIDGGSKYYQKSRQILQTLDGIDEIDHAYLPKASLYHEFI